MQFIQKYCPAWFPQRLLIPLVVLAGMGAAVVLTGLVFRESIPFWWYYLPWNMFLAALPLPLAWGVLWAYQRNKRLLSLPFWLLWLFFFPNAPYIITDLIHTRYYSDTLGGMYLAIPREAVGFLHLCAGVAVGCVTGMLSLVLLQRCVARNYGVARGWLLVAIVMPLSGLGVWIGRCLRFNSWDVLRPVSLLRQVLGSFDLEALQLCVIFTIMGAGAYLLTRALLPAEGK